MLRALLDRVLLGDMRPARLLLDLRSEAQAQAAQKEAQPDRDARTKLTLALAKAIRAGKLTDDEGLDAGLSSDSTSPCSPPAGQTTETPPAVGAVDPVEGKQDVGPACDEFPELHGDCCCEQERPETDRSEGHEQARARPAPSPPVNPELSPSSAYKSGPLVRTSDAWSGHCYGIGGAARYRPECGIFR